MQDELNGLQVKKWVSHSALDRRRSLTLSRKYRKILPGPIDVHPTDQALVIHYIVQASIYDETKTKVAEEQKEMSKTYAFLTESDCAHSYNSP
jgi:hypothetical protein